MVKQMFILLLATAIFFTASANTARLKSLSYNEMFTDPLYITITPSAITYYPDLIQGTAFGETRFGPIIMTKSIGEIFTIGNICI